MAGRSSRALGIFGVSPSILASLVVGCGKEQASPPAQTAPPAGTAQTAPAMMPTRNVSQLQIGMSSEQVQQIMGAPGKTKQEGPGLEWKYFTPQGGKVEVKMLNNRVTAVEMK